MIEEEEREQAVQRKVRGCSTLTLAELHGTRLDGVSIAHGLSASCRARGMALVSQGKQPMSKGKAKGGAGGGPSTKAAAGAGSSGQGSSRPSAPPARIIGLSTEEDAVQAAPPLAAEAAGAAQQTEPEPAGGGSTKKERSASARSASGSARWRRRGRRCRER